MDEYTLVKNSRSYKDKWERKTTKKMVMSFKESNISNELIHNNMNEFFNSMEGLGFGKQYNLVLNRIKSKDRKLAIA